MRDEQKPHVCRSYECCERDESGDVVNRAPTATREEVAAYCAAHPDRIEELAELGPQERASAVYDALHPAPPGLADVDAHLRDALLHLRTLPQSEAQANALHSVRAALAALYGESLDNPTPHEYVEEEEQPGYCRCGEPRDSRLHE